MLVAISDLHFQDTVNDYVDGVEVCPGRNVPLDAFKGAFGEILALAKGAGAKEITIVFAGDIFDIYRSQLWFNDVGVRPYDSDGTAKCFDTVAAILAAIEESNSGIFGFFRSFPEETYRDHGIRVGYRFIPGNHDRVINSDPRLQDQARTMLHLEGTGPFGHAFRDPDYGALIIHGHEYDANNFAGTIPESGIMGIDSKAYDAAPLGDYVTIDIVTAFAHGFRTNYPKEIMSSHTHRALYRKLLEFADVRPRGDIIDFLEFGPADTADVWELISPIAETIAKRALDSKFCMAGMPWRWRLLLYIARLLPVKIIPIKELIKVISTMKGTGRQPCRYAVDDGFITGGQGRFMVAGHTHAPAMEFLTHRGDESGERFFFDTGTWRTQIRKCVDGRSFAGAKSLTYVVFYKNGEHNPEEPSGKSCRFDYRSGYTT